MFFFLSPRSRWPFANSFFQACIFFFLMSKIVRSRQQRSRLTVCARLMVCARECACGGRRSAASGVHCHPYGRVISFMHLPRTSLLHPAINHACSLPGQCLAAWCLVPVWQNESFELHGGRAPCRGGAPRLRPPPGHTLLHAGECHVGGMRTILCRERKNGENPCSRDFSFPRVC